jgi:hypothetical protein
MAENCKNCGLELFAAQRFCRSCGAPTEQLSEEQVPTRMMPPQPEGWGARSGASTAPTSRPETTPVYDPSAGYQPTVPPSYPSVVPPYAPPRSRSPLGWIIAFIGTGLFVVVVLAVMFIARAGRRAVGDFHAPSPPREMAQQPGETPLNEANADQVLVSGNETTLIKTFALDEDAKFSIKNVSGSIVVEGWDQPKAEVKVIRQGPDRGGQVFFTSTSGNLSLRTAQPGRASQDVRYEVKLPREMGRVTLNSLNGSIKLTGVSGQIFAEGTNGSIELTDVTGVSKVQTVNGKIKAVLQEASDGPMEFTAANGSIDLTIKSDFDADLEASTVRGGINIDDQFGITVQKEMVGQRARGQIGSGGEPLRISTVNGSMSIRLAK